MSGGHRLTAWVVENWSRMALSFAGLALYFPWGLFLLVYFAGAIASVVLCNAVGILAAVVGHAVILVYALRRRARLGG